MSKHNTGVSRFDCPLCLRDDHAYCVGMSHVIEGDIEKYRFDLGCALCGVEFAISTRVESIKVKEFEVKSTGEIRQKILKEKAEEGWIKKQQEFHDTLDKKVNEVGGPDLGPMVDAYERFTHTQQPATDCNTCSECGHLFGTHYASNQRCVWPRCFCEGFKS